MIKVRNLFVKFTKEFYALYDINLDVENSERVAIVGERDSGKTTLLRVIANLEKFSKGEVYLQGTDVRKIDFKRDLSVAYVPKLFVFKENKTVYENLEYVLKIRNIDKSAINLKIVSVMQRFYIEGIRNVPIKNLTSYQKTLVQLARICLRKIDLYLIDDILSGLDNVEQEKIVELLKDMIEDNSNATYLFAFNNDHYAEIFGCRIVRIKSGSIVKED